MGGKSVDKSCPHPSVRMGVGVGVEKSQACVCFLFLPRFFSPVSLSLVGASVHVSKLAESRPPVVEVIVVLVSAAAGRADGAERASRRAATLVVEHQQRVVRWSGGVAVGGFQSLRRQNKK